MPINLKKTSKSVFLGFSNAQLSVIAGAIGIAAFVHFSDSGIIRSTADETLGSSGNTTNAKLPAETCLLREGDKFTNECNEGIRVLHCGPSLMATENIRGRTCHEATLNPRASFSIAGEIGPMGVCYRSEMPYVRPGGRSMNYICD